MIKTVFKLNSQVPDVIFHLRLFCSILANEKFNKNSTLRLQLIKIYPKSPSTYSHIREMARENSLGNPFFDWQFLYTFGRPRERSINVYFLPPLAIIRILESVRHFYLISSIYFRYFLINFFWEKMPFKLKKLTCSLPKKVLWQVRLKLDQ